MEHSPPKEAYDPRKPIDRLAAAISIVQREIMSRHSDVNTDVMFGLFDFKTAALEEANQLLVGLIGPVDGLSAEEGA